MRFAPLGWDWTPKHGKCRWREGAVLHMAASSTPATRPVSMVVFLCEPKRGVLGSWFRLGKNSWHGRNRAGSRKWCHEVTNRKRWWQHDVAALGANSRKALLHREGRWRGRVCLRAACFAQVLFMLSGYLNSNTRLVKAYLHFCSCEDSEGDEWALATSFWVTLALLMPSWIINGISCVRRGEQAAVEGEAFSRKSRG